MFLFYRIAVQISIENLLFSQKNDSIINLTVKMFSIAEINHIRGTLIGCIVIFRQHSIIALRRMCSRFFVRSIKKRRQYLVYCRAFLEDMTE